MKYEKYYALIKKQAEIFYKSQNCEIGQTRKYHLLPVIENALMLADQEIDELVGELKQYGLKGLETRHSSQTREDYLEFAKIAKKYNLIETCGSDYHGPNVKPWLELGMIEKVL